MADSTRTRVESDTTTHTGGRSPVPHGKSVHHGRTGAAWTGSLVAMAATILGGIGVMMQNWVLFWIAVAMALVGLVVARILQSTGHGAH